MQVSGGKPKAVYIADQLSRCLQSFRQPLLRYFSLRLDSRFDAEDLVQEVFLRILKRHADNQPAIDNFSAYVFGVASNALTDHFRFRKCRHINEHDEYEQHQQDCSNELCGERVMSSSQSLICVKRTLKTLPAETRHIFMLRTFQQRSCTEIAEILDLSTRTVERHVALAIKKIHKAFNDS